MERHGPDTALIEAAQILSAEEDLDAILQRVASLATGPLGYETAVVYLVDEDGRTLHPAAEAGRSMGQATEELALSADAPAARAARERRTVAEADRRAVPLLLSSEGGILVGVLEAHGDPRETGSADALAALADLAAVAIGRTRLQSALDERSEWFERLSEIDPLTGLANRRTLDRALELELLRAARQGTTLAVVVFDVAGFADLNERLGRAAGDDALRRLAALLTQNVRLIDTVARYGPDEFVVLAPSAAGPALAERIVSAAGTHRLADGMPLRLRAGRAVYPDDGLTADELLRAAERRLREGMR